jgi:hypothetical protein
MLALAGLHAMVTGGVPPVAVALPYATVVALPSRD